MTDEPCLICEGEGWVCEDHPSTKWNDGKGHWLPNEYKQIHFCQAAGASCKCNKELPPWHFKRTDGL